MTDNPWSCGPKSTEPTDLDDEKIKSILSAATGLPKSRIHNVMDDDWDPLDMD